MNLTFRQIAVLLILVYLFLPVAGFAHVAAPKVTAMELRSTGGVELGSPCDHCPYSNEHESDCCDTTACSCAFHTPPSQNHRIRYAPVVGLIRLTESFRALPQVFLPIYVPPQNRCSEYVAGYIGTQPA